MIDQKDIDQVLSYEEKYKRLKMQKKKNLTKMKRAKRAYIKSKIEKKRINKEVKILQKEWAAQVAADPSKATAKFEEIVKAVTNEDIFPRDLEDEFNKIEHDHLMGKKRNMKVEDLSNGEGLNIPMSIPDKVAKELDESLEDDTKAVSIDEVDEETKALLSDTNTIGLSDLDLFIDEEGNETEK